MVSFLTFSRLWVRGLGEPFQTVAALTAQSAPYLLCPFYTVCSKHAKLLSASRRRLLQTPLPKHWPLKSFPKFVGTFLPAISQISEALTRSQRPACGCFTFNSQRPAPASEIHHRHVCESVAGASSASEV